MKQTFIPGERNEAKQREEDRVRIRGRSCGVKRNVLTGAQTGLWEELYPEEASPYATAALPSERRGGVGPFLGQIHLAAGSSSKAETREKDEGETSERGMSDISQQKC